MGHPCVFLRVIPPCKQRSQFLHPRLLQLFDSLSHLFQTLLCQLTYGRFSLSSTTPDMASIRAPACSVYSTILWLPENRKGPRSIVLLDPRSVARFHGVHRIGVVELPADSQMDHTYYAFFLEHPCRHHEGKNCVE